MSCFMENLGSWEYSVKFSQTGSDVHVLTHKQNVTLVTETLKIDTVGPQNANDSKSFQAGF